MTYSAFPPVITVSCQCARIFRIVQLPASLFTSFSSHLFLGFRAVLFLLRLPSRIHFVFLLSNIRITCSAHFDLFDTLQNPQFLFIFISLLTFTFPEEVFLQINHVSKSQHL
jgi:hypothetical protein